MNRLIEALGNICIEHPFAEKYLLCPSLRTGQIWLDRTAVNGVSPINVRIKTIKGLAFELADTKLRAKGQKPVGQYRSLIILHQILSNLNRHDSTYFATARIGASLTSGTLNTITTLKLAGLTADRIEQDSFESVIKGLNIKHILQEYQNALEIHNLVDYADVLLIAAPEAAKRFAHSHDVFVIIPDDLEFSKLENDLIKALPGGVVIPLVTDSASNRTPDVSWHDSDLLVYFQDPHCAPEARGDGSANIFSALGPSNEIKEVLRRIIRSNGMKSDSDTVTFGDVEILHTDYETYVPLIYETLQSVMMSLNKDSDPIPATFAEGIPIKYSRPARALGTWLKWEQEDHPQSLLVEMIADGLLKFEQEDELPTRGAIAQTLRRISIVSGLNRTGQILGDRLNDLLATRQSAHNVVGASNVLQTVGNKIPTDEVRCLESLVLIVDKLTACSNIAKEDGLGILEGALTFLETCARSVNEMDNYALVMLSENLRQMQVAIEPGMVLKDFNLSVWIVNLIQKLRIMGVGPRPGMLHVDNLYSGGHTGRQHTFIVGMDDDRFPGAGLHDPLLMDIERERLSKDLPQAKSEPGKRIEKLGRLVSRLRGNVSLSYSCLDVSAERSGFPSPALFSAFRILSNMRHASQADMIDWLGLPASFAANNKECALTVNEWLTSAFCSENVKNKTGLLGKFKPDVLTGLVAIESRLSDDFTPYDGYLGPLVPAHDPTSPLGPVMSSASLETIGACPLKYFFKHILKIRPMDSIALDHSKWLDNLTLGSLLHDTFYHFIAEVISEGRHPNVNQDKSKLFKLLDRQLNNQAALTPPPNRSSMRRQVLWLEKSSLVFLVEEEIASREWSPLLLEASIGLKRKPGLGSMERYDPVTLSLSNNTSIRIGGKIDRVDRRVGETRGIYRIIDYKTGSPKTYLEPKNYSRGKIVQHAIYLHMAEIYIRSRTREKTATCDFAFFFPTLKAHGLRILKNAQECRMGTSIVSSLCDIIADGIFLPTVDEKNCSYCDYSLICGNAAITTTCSRNKLENLSNLKLEPFRKILSDA